MMIKDVVPNLLGSTQVYLEEAVAGLFADCFLAATVSLGVAAEAEFLRLLEVAGKDPSIGAVFEGE